MPARRQVARRRGGLLVALILAAWACGGAPPPAAVPEPVETCEPRAGGPSQSDCEAAVAHLVTLMPDAMRAAGREDVCDCLAMPAPLVACLAGAVDSSAAEACASEAVNGPRPSRAGCEAAMAHMRELAPEWAGELDARGAQLVDECEREGTQREVDCIMAAKSRAEVEKCDR